VTGNTDARHTDYIFIGIVGRPHGLHGAFFVSGRTEPVPTAYKKIFIDQGEAALRSADVTVSRTQGDRPVIQCSLATSREQAAALTGARIYVSRTVAHSVHRDAALWSDIIGCAVVTASGRSIGRAAELYDNGATGVLRIVGTDGDTADIPLVPALFDLDDVSRIRTKKELSCLLPEEAVAAYWSRELAKQDGE
jgi:16S rRNA processing protein RimM